MNRIALAGLLIIAAAEVGRADGFTVSTWVDMDDATERRALDAAGRALDQLDLFNFSINASGGFAEGAVRDHARFIARAHERGATVSITFVDFVGSAKAVVKSDVLTRHFARAVARVCAERGVDGVDLDFETLPRASRDAFTRFVRIVATELHARGKRLAVTVLPRAEGTAFDVAALAAAADRVKIMTYDYSGSWSAPGPIGPLPWCREVIERFVALGAPRSKLVLGVSLYGRSWPGGRNVSASRAARLARAAGAPIMFERGESRARVGPTTYWFPDARSIDAKVALARELGLAGVACFNLSWATDEQLEALARARRGGLVDAFPVR
jgi:spore germination protein